MFPHIDSYRLPSGASILASKMGSPSRSEVDDASRVTAKSIDEIGTERQTSSLTWLAKHLAAHGESMTTLLPGAVGALQSL